MSQKMIKIGRNALVVLVAFFSLWAMGADVQIRTELDRQKVEIGESFQLQVSIDASGSVDVGPPEFPRVENFLLLDTGQATSQQVRFVNGKVESKRTLTFTYELQAKKLGNLSIPSMNVIVDGKPMKTKNLRVQVVDAGTLPSRPQARNNRFGNSPFGNFPGFDDDPFDRLLRNRNRVPQPKPDSSVDLNPNEAFQIRVVTDKTEVYVGEQVTANYYIYVPSKYVLTSFDAVKYPNLQGFWKEDIEMAQSLRYESVVVDGIPYNRALLASYALFPIKEGRAKLDEYKAKCDMAISGFMGLGKPRSYTKSSLPINLKVKALPLQNRPTNFTGAVGNFQMTAKLGAERIKAHQPFSYVLKVEGEGNAKSIELPALDLPQSLELFDQKEESKFFKDGRSFKEFTLYFIPREEGDLKIPEISMGVFNPATESYEQIKSGEVILSVAAGEKPQIAGVNPEDLKEASTKTKSKSRQLFPFVFDESSSSFLQKNAAYGNLLLFLLILVFSFLHAKKELAWGGKQQKIIEVYESRAKKLKGFHKSEDLRSLGVEGTNTIYAILNLCLDDVESGAEIDKVLIKLSPKLRTEIEEPLKRSLKDFQSMAFAPEEILGAYKDQDKRKKIIQDVDQVLKKLIEKHES